jgi:hypothetical protein
MKANKIYLERLRKNDFVWRLPNIPLSIKDYTLGIVERMLEKDEYGLYKHAPNYEGARGRIEKGVEILKIKDNGKYIPIGIKKPWYKKLIDRLFK